MKTLYQGGEGRSLWLEAMIEDAKGISGASKGKPNSSWKSKGLGKAESRRFTAYGWARKDALFKDDASRKDTTGVENRITRPRLANRN